MHRFTNVRAIPCFFANMKLAFIAILLFLLCANSTLAQVRTDTTSLFFASAIFELRPDQKAKTDSLIDFWKTDFPHKIEILGYADHIGDSATNAKLSLRRARKVKQQLLIKIPGRFIYKCSGNGELQASENDTLLLANQRRVDVISFHKVKRTEVKIPANVKALFQLDTISTGQNIVIPNVNFHPGRHYPLSESVPIFYSLAKTMKDNPSLKIEIHGHICCQLGDADGMDLDTGREQLSLNRAKFVYQFLVKNGISHDRLSYKGFGRSRPLVKYEKTEADRIKNRRVEIKIISK